MPVSPPLSIRWGPGRTGRAPGARGGHGGAGGARRGLAAAQGAAVPRPARVTSAPSVSAPAAAAAAPLVEVRGLVKHFPGARGFLGLGRGAVVRAVDGVSFTIVPGRTLGLVGESGCGKTTVGRSMLRLIEPDAGQVTIGGQQVLTLGGRELRALRRRMQIVFQDPYGSLNPRMTVRQALAEPLAIHRLARGAAAERRVSAVPGGVGARPTFAQSSPPPPA